MVDVRTGESIHFHDTIGSIGLLADGDVHHLGATLPSQCNGHCYDVGLGALIFRRYLGDHGHVLTL